MQLFGSDVMTYKCSFLFLRYGGDVTTHYSSYEVRH